MISGVMEPETAAESVAEQVESTAVEAVDSAEQAPPDDAKPEPVSAEQANRLIGKVHAYDEVVEQIGRLQTELEEIEDEITDYKKQLVGLRKDRDKVITKLSAHHKDLRDIKNGQYQRKLFAGVEQPKEKPKPVDPATITPVANLGMSEKETDLLTDAEIKTIADLEARMRSDMLWHRKIKGFGPAKVDKLVDQLELWRRSNPVPSEDDEDDDEVIATDSDDSGVVAEAEADTEDDDEGLDAFDLDGEETQDDE